jgi:hypothetical protein
MGRSRIDFLLLAVNTFGLGVVSYSVLILAYALAGYLGIGLVGLVIGSGALTVDLEKEGGAGDPQTSYARHMAAQHLMPHAQRAAHRTEVQSLARPILIAKIMSGVLIIVGFGGFYLYQLV